MGIGVCWWHSRFVRNAAYLAIFDPSANKLQRFSQGARGQWRGTGQIDTDFYIAAINQIQKGKTIVYIPGYKNLWEFSRDFARAIDQSLSQWQMSESIWGAGWLKGLQGNSNVTPRAFESVLNEAYQYLKKDLIPYQMLQIQGPGAHSWLILNMELDRRKNYLLTVVDSNFTRPFKVTYQRGTRSLYYPNPNGGGTPFVPVNQFQSEVERLKKTADYFCSRKY